MLFLSENNTGAHSFFRDKGRSQEVDCTTLRDLLHEIPNGSIDLLKIDCEGSEYDILMGTDEENSKRIDRIVMETHHTHSSRDQDSKKLYHMLSEREFVVTILETTYTNQGINQIVSAVRLGNIRNP